MTGSPGGDLLQCRLRAAADAVAAEVDGEAVLYQVQRRSLTVLDRVGSTVWTLLDGTVTVDALCQELADVYGAPLQQVRRDVLELVARLVRERLLESA